MRSTFALSWNVQWLGSFPLSGTDAETVSRRLDRFRPNYPPVMAQLSISLSGVRVFHDQEKCILLCHPIRRIHCVVGRGEHCQVAYITREPAGEIYRRLCHLFKTESVQQVDEIESVLGNAFETAALTRNISSRGTNRASYPVLNPNEPQFPSPIDNKLHRCSHALYEAKTTDSKHVMQDIQKSHPSNPENCKVRTSASASSLFLNRLFGKSRTNVALSDVNSNGKNNEKESSTKNNENNNENVKRRRRPVSAVFTQALQRFSSSSTHKKRFSSVDAVQKEEAVVSTVMSKETTENTDPVEDSEKVLLKSIRNTDSHNSNLHYDQRLSEWIYPVDETLERQLEQVAYFCKATHRHRILKALLNQPEGTFILRISESKDRCLALSVRVSYSHNPSGISHYLIIRNDKGFRIKGANKSFPSIPMLITHHSVMPEQLPCRLKFSQWYQLWQVESNNNYDYPPCEQYDCQEKKFS